MACHVRRDDTVEVISGVRKGQRGKVLRVMPKKDLVVIEGVNLKFRHVKPSRQNPQGGRIQKEMPLHISTVLPVDPKTNRPARVRFDVERGSDGKVLAKRRVTVNGTVLGEVTRRARGA